MNERIRELAHKAEFINKRHNGDFWRWGYIDPELNSKLEKFAELIVRECAGLFPNVYVSIEHEHGHTPVVAVDYIKKHFGVEE